MFLRVKYGEKPKPWISVKGARVPVILPHLEYRTVNVGIRGLPIQGSWNKPHNGHISKVSLISIYWVSKNTGGFPDGRFFCSKYSTFWDFWFSRYNSPMHGLLYRGTAVKCLHTKISRKKFPKILHAAGWGAPHCESTEKVRPRPVATAARQCAQKRFLPNFFSDTIVLWSELALLGPNGPKSPNKKIPKNYYFYSPSI